MSHHHAKKRGRGRMILLWALAFIAVVFAVTALVKVLDKTFIDKPGQTASDGGSTQTGGDAGESGGDGTDGQTGSSEPNPTEEELSQQRKTLLDECDLLRRGYFYDEAIDKLKNAGTLQNTETDALLQKVLSEQSALVPYDLTTSTSYHVFFHSLIVDTSKAFDGDDMEAGYNMYMTTVSEFQKMLPLLQKNGFILYNIMDMVDYQNGKVTPKTVYLPAGKKPLVLSIDDVDYYKYMQADGFASRLDVDDQGNVVTVVKDDAGVEHMTYDGDVMPILDAYVKEHPEFSWQGAKGIVATTGYQGAFGYRITDLDDYDAATQKQMLDKVTAVAKALRATGWEIANHSYTHNQYWNNKTMTMEQCKYDTGRWVNEIMPYVGETHIFISPFGVSFDQDDARFQYLLDNGFYIYCPVDSNMPMRWHDDNVIQGRLNLDGITMMKYPERVSKYFFDPAQVLDPARPPMN
jgi:hypothetical protein